MQLKRSNGEIIGEGGTLIALCKEHAADLSYANLYDAELRYANLSDANLRGANLRRANLSYADLHGAVLSDANLRGANLRRANLSDANLTRANLHGADLSGTCLDPANEPNADTAGFEHKGTDVIGYRTRTAGHIDQYRDGRIYAADWFSTDTTACHPGLYLCPDIATARRQQQHIGELIRVVTRKADVHRAADKWRCRWFRVLGAVEGG
jgi:uncharacterized protein YjbI with pentapeptide repeats